MCFSDIAAMDSVLRPWQQAWGRGAEHLKQADAAKRPTLAESLRSFAALCGGTLDLAGWGGAHSRPRGTIFKRRSQFGFPAWNPRDNLHTSVGKDHGIAD